MEILYTYAAAFRCRGKPRKISRQFIIFEGDFQRERASRKFVFYEQKFGMCRK